MPRTSQLWVPQSKPNTPQTSLNHSRTKRLDLPNKSGCWKSQQLPKEMKLKENKFQPMLVYRWGSSKAGNATPEPSGERRASQDQRSPELSRNPEEPRHKLMHNLESRGRPWTSRCTSPATAVGKLCVHHKLDFGFCSTTA